MKEVDEQMLNIQNKNSSYFVEVGIFSFLLLVVILSAVCLRFSNNYFIFIVDSQQCEDCRL